MKTLLNAALLNFLIFPGSGHMLLNRKKTGMAIIGSCLVALAGFLLELIKQLWHLLEETRIGQGDPAAINLTTIISQQLADGNFLLPAWLSLILVCWLGSTLDIMRMAKKACDQR